MSLTADISSTALFERCTISNSSTPAFWSAPFLQAGIEEVIGKRGELKETPGLPHLFIFLPYQNLATQLRASNQLLQQFQQFEGE